MAEFKNSAEFHARLESEIKNLSSEVLEKRKIEKLPEKEALIAVVKEKLTATQEQAEKAAPSPPRPAAPSSSALPAYAQDDPAEIKLEVEKLLDAAIHQGLSAAFKQAIQKPPYILDVFHDAIVDKLYLIMKEKKYL